MMLYTRTRTDQQGR